ncbi:MAG: VOC family protein [Sphingomonas sp.]|uniref:VOC family protein n=1 Tax=Sphingomonas sp. TaxID=28214 RepID=UPI001AD00F03|nr:VOC family protein [Sphingomonas sp.]MBN8816948.1 VOC family protein [Sphingomonas sp.]
MRNPEGTPIWYELLTPDHDASKAFYDHVIGWTIGGKPDGGMDYRMIGTSSGEFVGGVMQLTGEMTANGAKPTWLFYIGVEDVDASFDKVKANGGGVLMPPFDIPGAGRAAFVTDPQGNPFYIMRGNTDQASTAYDRTGMGKCNWNELNTPDQVGANAFYADTFGWTYPDKMSMGDLGDYFFVMAGDTTIGATMTVQPHDTAGWRFYFRTPDIDDTAKKVVETGGAVLAGPMEVPGGDRIIVATDPHGVVFGAVGPGNP